MPILHFLSPHPAQAEIEGDRQLFALILPHLTFFLDVTKHCGFMSEELKDSMPMGQPHIRSLGTETPEVLRMLRILGT